MPEPQTRTLAACTGIVLKPGRELDRTERAALALRLHDQGWQGLLPLLPADAEPAHHLPLDKAEDIIKARGKGPGRYVGCGRWTGLSDWRGFSDDEATVARWATWPGVNIGLRACHAGSGIVYLDADILDPTAAGEVTALIRRKIGLDALVRYGRAPKALFPVRVRDTIRKLRSTVVLINGDRCMLEVLAEGQQAAIAGIHPVTGKPYSWPLGGLEDIGPEDLPELTASEIGDFVVQASAILRRHGPEVGCNRAQRLREGGGKPRPLEELRARDETQALEAALFIRNEDWARDDWVAWAYALRGAFGDKGLEFWLDFTAQSKAKHHSAATARKVWADATKAEEEGRLCSGAGTIFKIARDEGWTPTLRADKGEELRLLPDFGPVRADRDAALAEQDAEISQTMLAMAERLALRKELEKQQDEAKAAAERTFLRKVGKVTTEELDASEKRRLTSLKGRASQTTKAAFLAEKGITAMPKAGAKLFTGGQGTGKSKAVARAVAKLTTGNIVIRVGHHAKAAEWLEDLERYGARMVARIYLGRLADVEPRMCGRDKKLIGRAMRNGVRIGKTFCARCPLRDDCRFRSQRALLMELEGAVIVIAVHETGFVPVPFKADLEIIDEDLASKTAQPAIEIDPSRLRDPEKWKGRPELLATAMAVKAAMKRLGQELASLREAGIGKSDLEACVVHLGQLHKAEVEAIAEEGKGGASERRLSQRLEALELAELRKLQALLSNLAIEIGTTRPGTNATRLVRGRRRMVRQEDGSELEERLDRYVISRRRKLRLGKDTERVVLDGTGNLELNRIALGPHVEERRYTVPRKGLCIQVRSHTNSKARLLGKEGEEEKARKNRAELGEMIANTASIVPGEVLVGASKKVRLKLEEEGLLKGVRVMHYGAERGVNSAEHCKAVVVVGREEPPVRNLEDQARGFAVDREEPFVSVLDANEEGRLLRYWRRRRMTDGSEVLGESDHTPTRSPAPCSREYARVASCRWPTECGLSGTTGSSSSAPTPLLTSRSTFWSRIPSCARRCARPAGLRESSSSGGGACGRGRKRRAEIRERSRIP
jgi:hypothetical protein